MYTWTIATAGEGAGQDVEFLLGFACRRLVPLTVVPACRVLSPCRDRSSFLQTPHGHAHRVFELSVASMQ